MHSGVIALYKLKLNRSVTLTLGILITYGLFQSIILDVSLSHIKNLFNLVGFVVILSFYSQIFSRFSNDQLARYAYRCALFWVLALLIFNFLFLNIEMAYNNLKWNNLNHFYLAINNATGFQVTQKQTLAQLFTIGFFASFQVKNPLLRYIILLSLFYIISGSRSCTIGIIIALLAKKLSFSRNVNFVFIFYVTFIAAWLIIFNIIPESFREILNFDVRFAYFSAAYDMFLYSPFWGVGLFNVADFMTERNDYFLAQYENLNDFNGRFGNGLESGMLQFFISSGILGSFWIYLIGSKHTGYIRNNGWNWISLSFVAIFVSSAFEDNLLFPIFYFMLTLILKKQTNNA